MQYEGRWWRVVLLVFGVGLGVVTVLRITPAIANGPTPQQDVIRLENRIGQLEQRLFTIETGLRTLEQQSRLTSATSRGSISPEDLAQLRSEIQILQRRLADDECGLAKLDERTLSPAARDARRKLTGSDPCRVNVDTPLRLPELRP